MNLELSRDIDIRINW